MSKYFWQTDGIERDELSGGPEAPLTVWNVNVGASAVIERGQLLCASSPTADFALVSSAGDASKVLGVAVADFTADADHTVTQIYSSGKFNRERIILGGDSSLTLDIFENEMRRQNIHLTSIKKLF